MDRWIEIMKLQGPDIYRDLIVSGVPSNQKNEFIELCSKFGTVVRCFFQPGSPTPSDVRTACVTMSNHLEAALVISCLQFSQLQDDGPRILIAWDIEKTMEDQRRHLEMDSCRSSRPGSKCISSVSKDTPAPSPSLAAFSTDKVQIYCRINGKEVILAEILPEAVQSLRELLNKSSEYPEHGLPVSPAQAKEVREQSETSPSNLQPNQPCEILTHRSVEERIIQDLTAKTAQTNGIGAKNGNNNNRWNHTAQISEQATRRFRHRSGCNNYVRQGTISSSKENLASISGTVLNSPPMVPRSVAVSSLESKSFLPGPATIIPAAKIHKGSLFTTEFEHLVTGKSSFWTHMLWVENDEPIIHVWIGTDAKNCNPPEMVLAINQFVTRFYQQANLVKDFRPVVDQPVAIRLEDGTWTRGSIVELDGPVAYIERIDIGGYAAVEVGQDDLCLQPLDTLFANKCPRMVKARIDGINPEIYDSELADRVKSLYYKDNRKVSLETSLVGQQDGIPSLRVFIPGYAGPYLAPGTSCILADLHAGIVPEVQFGFVIFAVPFDHFHCNYNFLFVNWEKLPALEELEARIQEAVKERLPVNRSPGSINAIKRNGVYQRCLTPLFLPASDRVSYELLDYGDIGEASLEDLVGLPEELQIETPVEAGRIEGLDRKDVFSYVRAHGELDTMAKDFLLCAYQITGKTDDCSTVRIWDPKNMSLICPKTVDKMAWFKERTSRAPVNTISSKIQLENPIRLSVERLSYEKPIQPGEQIEVKPTLVDGDWFAAVLNEKFYDRPDFLEMTEAMQANCPGLPVMTSSPEPDTVVYAIFSEDELWYRGVTISTPHNDKTLVTFVDFGNNECVPLKNIRLMDDEWLHVPRGSIVMADLSYVPVSGSFSEKERGLLKSLVEGRRCVLDVVDVVPQFGMISGILRIPSGKQKSEMVTLAEELVRAGIAVMAKPAGA